MHAYVSSLISSFKWLPLLFALATIMVCGSAWAQKPPNVTAGEMALLPPYCPDTMGFGYGDASFNTSPRAPYWLSRMGPGFWSMHHYCWALINLNRAQRIPSTSPERVGTLKKVVGDYVYVIENTDSSFVMLPEVYTRLGEVQILLKNTGAAHDAFARARSIKPDYWPAYSQWADFLIKQGLRADAQKVLYTGLQHAPDSKVLADLFRSIGQDPTKVQPLRKEAAAAAPAAPSEQPSSAPAAKP